MFVLASGSAALNQWQERKIDARMKRTRGRPIPAGCIDPPWAAFLALLFILLGLSSLSSVEQNARVTLGLGLIAVLWYNGVYTYLKRVTAFAVVPGALIGALPPCIGYVSAGGSLHDPTILLVALFFFIWQIPHFWLLLLMHGDEYRQAGLPTLSEKFAPPQLARVTFMWMLAAAAGGLALAVLNRVDVTLPWTLVLVIASIWLAMKATAIVRLAAPDDDKSPLRRAFWQINAYALMVMVCLSLGTLGR